MSIVFVTDGPWGTGIHRPVHAAEADGGFYDLLTRVVALEAGIFTPVQIVSFEVVNSTQFIVHMSNSTTLGPYQLPAWNFRGAWTASTGYVKQDVFRGPNGAVYLVIFNHTSGASFDPAANDGLGHNYYYLLLSAPTSAIPSGGLTDQVLGKINGTDYNVSWRPSGVPRGGLPGQLLVKASGADFDMTYVTPAGIKGLTSVNKSSTNYTLLATTIFGPGDEFKYLRFTGANPAVHVATNVDQPFAIDTEIALCLRGTGVLTVTGNAGVTVNRPAGFTASLLGTGAVVSLKKVDTDEWDMFGLLTPV